MQFSIIEEDKRKDLDSDYWSRQVNNTTNLIEYP
jgi:hypothetical protein